MKERRDDRFPNTLQLAHFSPEAQLVSLDAYGKDDLANAVLANDHDKASEILATISHELTHWAEVVGTLWGRGYLQRIYRAYRLLARRNQAGSEADFQELVALHDEQRRLTFPKYYQTVEPDQPKHGAGHPWVIGLSAGQEIDPLGRLDPTRPIMFVRFYDHDTGALLIRQPITVGALLETTAVASEFPAIFAYIEGKVPADQKVVMAATATKSILERLYAPELTLYSAPVHLFAHHASIKDAAAAYVHASMVAHLCLNLTDAVFDGLSLPQAMNPWLGLLPGFRHRRDRGFAFAVVCANLKPWTEGMDPKTWIDAALGASGLPDAAGIMAQATTAMAGQVAGEQAAYFDATEAYMLELGLAVAAIRGADTSFGPVRSMNALGLIPPMVDAEGELVAWPGNSFDFGRFDAEAMTNLDWALGGYTRNVISGCR